MQRRTEGRGGEAGFSPTWGSCGETVPSPLQHPEALRPPLSGSCCGGQRVGEPEAGRPEGWCAVLYRGCGVQLAGGKPAPGTVTGDIALSEYSPQVC